MIVFLETLGCSRNQVDSEIMLGKVVAAGHSLTDDPSLAHVIIVNTCTFISTASDEAVEVILQMAKFKEPKFKELGKCKKLIVTGCLAQRYKDDKNLASSLPEVDVFLGTAACENIVSAIEDKHVKTLTIFTDPNKREFQNPEEQRELLSQFFAYIKVSEGCNRKCTYCIIPQLRGSQRSRPKTDICKEAKSLVSKGIKEIILTAENTTDYGQDLSSSIKAESIEPESLKPDKTNPNKSNHGKADLNKTNQNKIDNIGFDNVLTSLSETLNNDNAWIRFLYTHPKTLTPELIRTVQQHKNICSYYDVPIQHASSSILKKMGRPYTNKDLYKLFKTIRDLDDQAVLRTTIIVGFPGESKEDFEKLLQFIKDIKFDHLGVFTYSDSQDLKSHHLKDHVPEDIAEKRHDMLMAEQAKISQTINEQYVGKIFKVLVEENPEPGVYIGRTMFQAPEVDGMTFIYENSLEINTFVNVRITDGFEYDIAGVVE